MFSLCDLLFIQSLWINLIKLSSSQGINRGEILSEAKQTKYNTTKKCEPKTNRVHCSNTFCSKFYEIGRKMANLLNGFIFKMPNKLKRKPIGVRIDWKTQYSIYAYFVVFFSADTPKTGFGSIVESAHALSACSSLPCFLFAHYKWPYKIKYYYYNGTRIKMFSK